MKKVLTILVLLFIASFAYADMWCQWSGTKGENCINDNNGVVRIVGKVPARTEAIINDHGYYRVTTTQPTIGEDQVRDDVVWGLAGNQMSRTWTVRDLTTDETDERDASPMPLSEYYLWRALIATGTITQQQAATYLPQELIDAYQARDRLENP